MMHYLSALLLFAFLTNPLQASEKLQEFKIAIVVKEYKNRINTPVYLSLNVSAVRQAIKDRSQDLEKAGIVLVAEEKLANDNPMSYFTIASNLVKSDFLSAVGFQTSKSALLSAKALNKSDMMVISTFATSTSLEKYQSNIFQFAGNNKTRARAIGKFIEKNFQGKEVLAAVSWDNDYSKNLFENLPASIKEKLTLIKLLDDQVDFSHLVSEYKRIKPDIVFNPNYPHVAGSIIRTLVETGFKGIFVAGASWGEGKDDRFLKLVKKVDFTGYTIRKYTTKKVSNTLSTLKSSIGFPKDQASIVPLLFYDSTNLLIDAVIKVGVKNLNRRTLAKAIKNTTEYTGVLGKNCFGSPTCNESLNILKVDSRGFSLASKIKQ